tara:strand:- start:106 stop:237 length:132 start_codon:yes stop_codon:yes gene_type:complete
MSLIIFLRFFREQQLRLNEGITEEDDIALLKNSDISGEQNHSE